MATPHQPTDPAQLGADRRPETSREDDSHDMSPVIAETDKDQSPDTAGQQIRTPQGSEFNAQRQQSAAGGGDPYGDVGRAQGQGRAGYNGDEDRGYETSRRGGLGGSGGRESHADRDTDVNKNPFTGSTPDQPAAEETKDLGLNTPSPTDKPEA